MRHSANKEKEKSNLHYQCEICIYIFSCTVGAKKNFPFPFRPFRFTMDKRVIFFHPVPPVPLRSVRLARFGVHVYKLRDRSSAKRQPVFKLPEARKDCPKLPEDYLKM